MQDVIRQRVIVDEKSTDEMINTRCLRTWVKNEQQGKINLRRRGKIKYTERKHVG